MINNIHITNSNNNIGVLFNTVTYYISCSARLFIENILTAMLYENVHNYPLIRNSRASQSILLHGTLKKLQNVRRNPYLSTISKIYH
jgi:hypothetical protein